MIKLRRVKQKLGLKTKIEKEFVDHVRDLLDNRLVWSMDNYIQHGGITCLEHSLSVSYRSYRVCKKLRLDHRSAARGALLHDFFLYDWHDKDHGHNLHGIFHPRTAYRNARKLFHLNRIEKDIIIKHMWPLTLRPPIFKEAIVVSIVDKYCAIQETIFKSGNSHTEEVKELLEYI